MPTATKKKIAAPKKDRAEEKKSKENKETKENEDSAGSRIRVKICAYDHKIIDAATKTIIDTAERNNSRVVGPVPLPTAKKKFSVNRSTFVHKTSSEQFEMRVHKRLIDILAPNPKAIEAFMNLNLPSGVDVEIKLS